MAEASIAPTLACRNCLDRKPIEAFTRNGRGPYGVEHLCKVCRGEKRRAAYADDPAAVLTENQKWRDTNREKVRACNGRWREQNAAKMREYVRGFYDRNPGARTTHKETYKRTNPERYRAKVKAEGARRRAAISGAGGRYTAADVLTKMEHQKRRCWYCAKPLKKYHVDHVTPLARGGSNGPENIVIACPPCNLSKGAKMPWEMEKPRLL